MQKLTKNIDGHLPETAFPNADEVIESVQEKGNEYWQTAKAKGQKLWNGAQTTTSQAKGFIQKNPGRAVGFAVLIGFLVGQLFRSNRSKGGL